MYVHARSIDYHERNPWAIVWIALSAQFELSGSSVVIVVLIAAISTLVEAITPHGWDNTTLQVVPAFLGAVLLHIGS